MIIFFIANNIAWIIFLIFFLSDGRSGLSSNAWTRMGQAKRQENAINSMTSFIFIRICTFHVCWWKNFALLFEDVTFFSELKSKTENNVTKCLHFYYQQGCLKVWKLLPDKIGSWFCLEFSSWWLFFDDPNIPHSYPKNRNQSHMPECCLSKMKRSLLKQTGNHGNQWTSYKGKCWFDP